jgi:hypothetical protein
VIEARQRDSGDQVVREHAAGSGTQPEAFSTKRLDTIEHAPQSFGERKHGAPRYKVDLTVSTRQKDGNGTPEGNPATVERARSQPGEKTVLEADAPQGTLAETVASCPA